MTVYQSLIEKLHAGKNPYTGFPGNEWSGVWFGDPGAQRDIFKRSIDRLQPKLIIEVGSFVGESAIFMADYAKAKKWGCAILAVDTWLFGFDHYKGAPEKITMHFGRPDLYYRFISNVIARGCQDVIVPFAMDSVNAARVLKRAGIQADMIYSDASHEEGDVLQNYLMYWELIRSGGGMLCDDWSGHFPGVLRDGERFAQEIGLKPVLVEGEKVLFIKP